MMRVLVGKGVRGEELAWSAMSFDDLAALASTPSLFGDERIFILQAALGDAERGEEFLEKATVFVESPHVFVFEEEKLLKAPTEALKKAGAVIEITKAAPKKERRFDEFDIAAALAARDRKRLWLGILAALRAGEKPEAVAGLLAWKARQIKNIKLARALLALYHDSHRGAGELDLLLERFALTL